MMVRKWNTRLVPSYANTGGNPGVPILLRIHHLVHSGGIQRMVNSTSGMWMPTLLSGCRLLFLEQFMIVWAMLVTNSTLSARNLATGVYDLSLALEGQATYDGNQILDLPISLELGQNLEVTGTNQVVTETDTD